MDHQTICNRCLSLVGLPDVVILDVEDVPGAALRVRVELVPSAQGCPECGVFAHVKDRRPVELVDLSMGGRPMRLVWLKRRFRCPESSCPMGSWTEDDPRIASKRLMMTDRAGRWITEQVGRCARSVSEVARELGCDWHTVNDAVVAYGSALVDHPDRFGVVEALGLDEVLMVKARSLPPPGVLHPAGRRGPGPAPRHRGRPLQCWAHGLVGREGQDLAGSSALRHPRPFRSLSAASSPS